MTDAADWHISRGESIEKWRSRFIAGHAHLDPIEMKLWLRHYIRLASRRPPISPDLRRRIYERDGRACLECGTTEHLSLDHIHPYSLGGEDTFANLRTLCLSCNSKKGARV